MSPYGQNRKLAGKDVLRACSPKEMMSLPKSVHGFGSSRNFAGFNQGRFMNALERGTCSSSPQDNIFILGIEGLGGFEIITDHIKRVIGKRSPFPESQDWCYVYNFDSPRAPLALPFPRGEGKLFKNEIERFLKLLKEMIPNTVTSEDAENRRRKEIPDMVPSDWFEQDGLEIEEWARTQGFILRLLPPETGMSPQLLPMSMKGSPDASGNKPPMTPEELNSLSHEEKKSLGEKQRLFADALELKLTKLYRGYHDRVSLFREAEEKINESIVQKTVQKVSALLGLEAKFSHNHEVKRFLSALAKHTVENYLSFFEKKKDEESPLSMAFAEEGSGRDPFLPWKVNLIVDQSDASEVPLVAKNIATAQDLVGAIDRAAFLGAEITDHMQITPGVLHEANGGFLIMDASDFLSVPDLWVIAKRALKSRQITFENPLSIRGLDTNRLHPKPIPLSIRVVLFGPAWILHFLEQYDDEFGSLFKFRGEILSRVPRKPEYVSAFGAWMQDFSLRNGSAPLAPGALARLVEHAGRLCDSQKDMATDFGSYETIVRHAELLRHRGNEKNIEAKHIDRALQEQFWRSDFYYESMQELVRDGVFLISVKGLKVGQINGLYVARVGSIAFGFPARIGARVNIGKPGLNHIEYDTKLGGNILGKGGMIVEGAHKGKFMQRVPFPVEAHICFEQSYNMVDGDSASVAQYACLASEVARIPIRQSIAVTGSLDLHGNIQPIGGVNEKIEGFFDVCKKVGPLSGEQGVVIPWQNKKDLMLRRDVVAAITKGKFHIWAVRTLNEAVSILTGMPANQFNAKVQESYNEYAKKMKAFSAPAKDGRAQKTEKKKNSKKKVKRRSRK
ncbi:MAG TPA: ATP-binding protein [Candidatus Paceibacterota bacterium]